MRRLIQHQRIGIRRGQPQHPLGQHALSSSQIDDRGVRLLGLNNEECGRHRSGDQQQETDEDRTQTPSQRLKHTRPREK